MDRPKTRTKPSVRTEPARRGLDMDKAAQKQKEVEDRTSGVFMELKEGWTFVYLLPPWSDEGVIWKEVEQHGRLVCPKRMLDKDCLICDEIVRRRKKGDTDFDEQHRLRSRAFFNAVRKDDLRKLLSSPAAVIKVLGVSSTVFREILEYINDEKVDVSDPSCAVPLGIKRTGKGMRTRYKVKFGEPVDISKYITAKVMDALHDLDALRAAQPASTKDMRKAIRGAADEDDEDFDGDEGTEDTDLDDEEEDIEEGGDEEEVLEEPEEEGEEGEEEEGEPEEEPEEEEPEPEEEEEEPEEEPEEEEPEPEPPRRVKPAQKPAAKPASKPAVKPKPGALASRVAASGKPKVKPKR